MRAKITLVFTVLFINIFLDRITKYLAVELLKGKASISFLWNSIVFQYIENSGAFLGLGKHWPEPLKVVVFIVIPLIVCFGALLHCLIKENDKTRIILMVTIVAGGIANLYDRLFHSFQVIDFLNFGIGNLRTGILNVADMSVTFGGLLLILYEYTKKNNDEI